MLKFHKLFSVSVSLFPVLKYSMKLNRILCSSGCLIAGCCFSKKSDEKAHISENPHKSNYDSFSKYVNVNSSPEFERHVSGSTNMKRSFESVNDTTSQNVVPYQSVVQEPDCKKKKTDFSQTTNEEHIQTQQTINELAITGTVTEPFKSDKEKFKTKRENPKRPNYFVAIKISNEQIHQELEELQSHILQEDQRLKKSMIDLKTLHITLFVMHIGDPETHARAEETLKKIHCKHDEDMSENPMLLKFQGLSHFNNRVLYAKLVEDGAYERLEKLTESVKTLYSSASIFSTDSERKFTPHLTVAKIDAKKRQKNPVKKIDPSVYEEFQNQYFGTQKVESIQLLSMMDPKTKEGYYSGTEIYFSAFEPSVRRDSFNKLLETEKKKKYVKQMINAAIKDNLK